MRTCVGCRGRGPRSELLKFVLAPCRTRVLADERKRLQGRGAWLHPDPQCLDKAITRRALQRALRVPVAVDVSAAAGAIEMWITNHRSET